MLAQFFGRAFIGKGSKVTTKTTSVFIAGLLSDERVWQPLAERLEHDLDITQAVFPDGSQLTSLRQMAADILAATDGPLDVFGHSMGGRIALDLVDLAPERVNSLVLADTGAHPTNPAELAKREQVIELAHSQGMQALCDQWLPPMVAEGCRADPEFMTNLEQMVLAYTPEQHESQIRALINRSDAQSRLADIHCPVLFITGSEDQWSPPTQHQAMQEQVASSALTIVPGAGHFAPLEAVPEFAEAVVQWYRGVFS